MTRTDGKKRKGWRFLREERGGITIESVLWLPLYFAFFALIVDVSLLFHGQSKAHRIAQDVNRLAVLGWMTKPEYTTNAETEAEMKARAEALLSKFVTGKKDVTVYFKDDRVQTFISIPAGNLQAVGLFKSILDFEIKASAAHIREL